MVVSANISLPAEEELAVQEINLSGPALRAGAFHLGKYCESQNNIIFVLPTEEELAVQEINLSGPALREGAFHLGKCCESQNNEFVLCRKELDDPRKCINEGKAVTGCSLEFFRKVKGTCFQEFTQYANCLDKSSIDLHYKHCRKTQAVFDKCMQDNLNLARPEFGYFCRPKVHDSPRPKPEPKQPDRYPDYTPYLPDDYPRPPAKYGSRFHWME